MSREWDEIYAAGKQMTLWPWSDLVSAVKRYCANADGNIDGKHVLELGCGPGANMPFFFQGGADYWGIDASKAALEAIPTGGIRLMHADFTQQIPNNYEWDLICDRAAVTHNDTVSIKRCLDMVFEALKPGGYYIGIDWFSWAHGSAHMGVPVDTFTRTGIPFGQFKDVGTVHFSSMAHMMELFHRFDVLSLSEKILSEKVLERERFASWNIIARKP